MPIDFACQTCQKPYSVRDDLAGRRVRCKACNGEMLVPGPADAAPVAVAPAAPVDLVALEQLAAPEFDPFAGVTPPAAPPPPKRYKVLTQKDKWFSGKFDPAVLEQALNAYADQGWQVKAAVTATIPGFGGNRDELVVIMER